jgi:hypothetical protein
MIERLFGRYSAAGTHPDHALRMEGLELNLDRADLLPARAARQERNALRQNRIGRARDGRARRDGASAEQERTSMHDHPPMIVCEQP